MPRYDYRCEANGTILEVTHGMDETVRTWGELCRRAGVEPGRTPDDTPVEKVVGLAFARTGGRSDTGPPGPCGPACGCHPR